MKSWKIGAIAGIVAGIFGGILLEISNNIAISIGLHETWYRSICVGNIIVNIPFLGLYGVLLGIIYSTVYSIIPKRGVLKGLIYGLILYFIIPIRFGMFLISYGLILWAAGDYFSGFFLWIAFGLLLAFIYELLHQKYNIPKKEKKIIQYDITSGILPGAIAGFCGGLAASVFAVIGHVTGYWGVFIEGEIFSTIDYWMSQAGSHIFINMLWGIIFGVFFAKVYNLVPGKKVRRGLYYGLIMLLITTFLFTTWGICWEVYHNEWEMALIDFLGLSIGTAQFIVFGIVLGFLYRK
jgi:hypothetical protein